MKKTFQDVEIDAWIERKTRLSPTQPVFCMRAEPEAIGTLLEALAETVDAGKMSRRTLTLKNQRAEGFEKIQLRFSSVLDGEKILSIMEKDRALFFEFTEGAVSVLESNLHSWKEGCEDFCIRSIGVVPPQELWLWRSMLP